MDYHDNTAALEALGERRVSSVKDITQTYFGGVKGLNDTQGLTQTTSHT